MTARWTAAAVRSARAAAQLLGDDRATDAASVARRVVAVQAQDVRAARLAVRVRSTGLSAADVDAACRDGELVRTWLMRTTLHMVEAGDARWLLRLFGARNVAATAGRRRALGLNDDVCERAFRTLGEVLADASLTRSDVVSALRSDGIDIDAGSQAPAHLMMYAASMGLICRGADTSDDEPTFTLLEGWLPESPEPPDPAADLARLAVRYATGHGPVGAEDLVRWTGLPLTQARRAFELAAAELRSIETDLGPLWTVPGCEVPRRRGLARVRLTSHFDGYLLGYRDRRLIVDEANERAIHTGGGFLMPSVLSDGRAVATWRMTRRGDASVVELSPFATRLGAAARRGVATEVRDIARFLGTHVALEAST